MNFQHTCAQGTPLTKKKSPRQSAPSAPSFCIASKCFASLAEGVNLETMAAMGMMGMGGGQKHHPTSPWVPAFRMPTPPSMEPININQRQLEPKILPKNVHANACSLIKKEFDSLLHSKEPFRPRLMALLTPPPSLV